MLQATGYDLATGLGSPVGALLIPRLVGPTVTGVSSTEATGAYGVGTAIPIRVTFSEAVTVTGTPQLSLNTGSGVTANYSSGSGTSTLTFTYIVAAGQNSSDLDYASTTALTLNGGTIKDAAGTAAVLTLPATGTDGLATRNITIDTQAPTVATAASATPNPVTGTTTSLSVLGADDGGESNLTYTWATTGTPPAAVTFSANGTNGAKNTTATFSQAGSYSFQVTITDAGGLTATSSVNVTVNQTLTSDHGQSGQRDAEREPDAAVHGDGEGPVRRCVEQPAEFHLGQG